MSETFEWCKNKTKLAIWNKQVLCVKRYGIKYWFFNGKYHREDGPAVEYVNGDKFWYLHGELHRLDGPAVECADGEKLWYLNGKYYTKSEYWKELKK